MKSNSELILQSGPLSTPWATVDPFLFCVHHDDRYPTANERMGPSAPLEGRRIGQDFSGKDGWSMYHGETVPGFPQHPHRGFETITVVRQGWVDHSDSLGAVARYGAGDVQWLTAGKGILHAEMFPLLHLDRPNPVELFQIWLNLPRANKMSEPHFSMFWKDTLPRKTLRDAEDRATELTVIAGSWEDIKAPAPPPRSWASRPEAEVIVWTAKLSPGARWTLPPAPCGVNRRIYFFRGNELRVGEEALPLSHWAHLRTQVEIPLQAGADQGAEVLVLQGRPIGEPVFQYGPFVMNTREEIVRAFEDFERTQFGGWPWKRGDPVHPRDEGRFARHADGRTEVP